MMNRLYLQFFGGFLSGIFLLLFLPSQSQVYTQPVGNTSTAIPACSGTYTDDGGTAANYAASCNSQFTICPMTAGQYAQVSFYGTFNLQSNKDFLVVYDGNGTGGIVIAVLTGTTLPGTYKASSTNASGCLTFLFISDGTTQNAGWTATISCSATPAPAATPIPNLDCIKKKKICTTGVFSEANSGTGVQELNASNQGCLGTEAGGGVLCTGGGGGSSWYFFTAATSGTVGFDIKLPSGKSDDYDFAVWGPNPNCPPTSAPARCSFFAPPSTAYGYNTGLNAASTDLSENTSGDGYVKELTVVAGETYVIYINRYCGAANGFTFQFNGTAALDCQNVYGSVPIQLMDFSAALKETEVVLKWSTATEKNNKYFQIERSVNGTEFKPIGQVAGAGNSSTYHSYSYTDTKPERALAFYRLKQVDNDDAFEYSNVITLYNRNGSKFEIKPNPVALENNSFSIGYYVPSDCEGIVSIKDMIGQEVYRKTFSLSEGENNVDVLLDNLKLNQNLYFLQLQTPFSAETQRMMVK